MKRLVIVLVCVTALFTGTAIRTGSPEVADASSGCPWAARPYPDAAVKRPVVATLTIGSIGLRTPVFQGWLPDIESEASLSLNHGPAFYPPGMEWDNGRLNHLPGQGGTVAMLGHRTTRTHPFCLLAGVPTGSLAQVVMKYGTFVYREVAEKSLPSDDWSAFERPSSYDPSPRSWNKGIKPEYLVTGACDPPHSAVRRINVVFKLVKVVRNHPTN